MGWGRRFRRAVKRVARPVRRIVRQPARAVIKHVMHNARVVRRSVRHPGRSIRRLARNPAKQLLSSRIRRSRYYRNVARPVIKVGVAAGAAYLTGGGSLLAAGAGAAVSVSQGGLTSKPFNPVRDVVAPAAAGWAVGAIQTAGGIGNAASGLGINTETAGSALGLVGKVSKMRKNKRKAARTRQATPAPVVQSVPDNQTKKKGVNWGAVATGAGAGFLVGGPIGAVVGGGAGAMIKGGK